MAELGASVKTVKKATTELDSLAWQLKDSRKHLFPLKRGVHWMASSHILPASTPEISNGKEL
jgi:hypothetical protein